VEKMTTKQRAKIFMPFDALRGFREALKKQEEIKVEKKEVSLDKALEIDAVLKSLKKGMLISVVYYNEKNSTYSLVTGVLTNISEIYKTITIVKQKINISDIYQIEIIEEKAI